MLPWIQLHYFSITGASRDYLEPIQSLPNIHVFEGFLTECFPDFGDWGGENSVIHADLRELSIDASIGSMSGFLSALTSLLWPVSLRYSCLQWPKDEITSFISLSHIYSTLDTRSATIVVNG